MALDDQLLVCSSRSKDVFDHLSRRGMAPRLIAKLLDPGADTTGGNLTPLHEENVEILNVNPPSGKDIFDVVDELRADTLRSDPRKVSPNHILIPANEDHSCPWGPPEPYDPTTGANELNETDRHTRLRRVTIIDSGYLWKKAWGKNPLDVYTGRPLTHKRAERLVDDGGWGTGKWELGTRDVPAIHLHPGTLNALSGHANFVAGVLAQRSPHAHIVIASHNGAFDETTAELTTEAHVLRSLCRCRGQSDVINLGFAFAALDDFASCAWDVAFTQIGEGTAGTGPVVVAPVGNQNSLFPRFPAALPFPNMIGVASTKAVGSVEFSNRGKWVTCSADGARVPSTFLALTMKVEDPPRPLSPFAEQWENGEPFDFTSGWATWSGTSFATPKVVAEIVNEMVKTNASPADAWKSLTASGTPDPKKELGFMFNF
jgi:thermitase